MQFRCRSKKELSKGFREEIHRVFLFFIFDVYQQRFRKGVEKFLFGKLPEASFPQVFGKLGGKPASKRRISCSAPVSDAGKRRKPRFPIPESCGKLSEKVILFSGTRGEKKWAVRLPLRFERLRSLAGVQRPDISPNGKSPEESRSFRSGARITPRKMSGFPKARLSTSLCRFAAWNVRTAPLPRGPRHGGVFPGWFPELSGDYQAVFRKIRRREDG